MKWLFYLIVLAYMSYRVVYGAKIINKLTVEKINYGENPFWKVGSHQAVSCKATNRNQKVEWVDPLGNIVKRHPTTSRVFAQEHFVQALGGGRNPGLVLQFKSVAVSDSGVYECRAGDLSDFAHVCVIEPAVFDNTPTEVVSDLGRSITLSCQAKGTPEPRIVWMRNEAVINDEEDGSKYKLMTKYNSEGFEGLLTVVSLKPEDSGDYLCLAVQETANLEDCKHSNTLNITLNVNFAPEFDGGNDTSYVYGKNNESVEIVCKANAYPTPTYRWFSDPGDGTLVEIDKKKILFKDDQAVLTVIAGQATFGQRYQCRATNEHGEADKPFMLLRIERPTRPSEVYFYNATDNKIQLNVSWDGEIQFPVDAFHVQYMVASSSKKGPKEYEWRKAVLVPDNQVDADENDLEGIFTTITNLEPETDYWIRLRAANDAGESPWSEPVFVSTAEKVEVEEVEGPDEEPIVSEGGSSDVTFYGIFFAGGLIIVAFVFMVTMRMV